MYIKANDPQGLSKEFLPLAKEKISWSMPTFYDRKNIIHFAGHKNHLGLYPGAKTVELLAEDLEKAGLKFSKGCIQIPYEKEMPRDLLEKICKTAYENQ